MANREHTAAGRARHIRLVAVDGEQIAPARRRPPRRSRSEKNWREVHIAMVDDHLATMQKALLLAASSLENAQWYAAELRAAEGLRREPRPNEAAFGDIVLFEEKELRIVPKPKKRKR